MKVKLCSRCPYTPRDLAGHFDPEGELHVCAKCDGEEEASTSFYPRKPHRRQRCVTAPDIPGIAQPTVARSATEGLASYGTTAAEQPSVQRNAPTALRHGRKVIADGYVGFTPPKSRWDVKYILVPTEQVEWNLDNPDGGNHLCTPPP
jgi:hypothetical protein